MPELLKFNDVVARLSVTRQTVYKLIATDPSFPRPIYLTPTCPRFHSHEIEAWLVARQAQPEPVAA